MKEKMIPEYVLKLFWDAKKSSIDIEKHSSYIIKRVLDFGDVPAVNWLLKTYPQELIKKIVNKKRGLHPKTITFWERHFENI